MLADTAFIDAGNCEYLERRAMCRKARAACTAATAAAAAAANARELVARGRREHTTGKHFSLQCWKGILWLIGGRAHEPKLYSPLRDSVNFIRAVVNVTACAGPGDESLFQNVSVSFMVCSNGLLLGNACNGSFEILGSARQGSARDSATGLICPLWGLEYRIPPNFYGSSLIAANATDEYGSSYLLIIPVDVEYVNNAPHFDVIPSILEIIQPESRVSVAVSFFNVSSGHLDVGQSVFFNVEAEVPSLFTEQPSLSPVVYTGGGQTGSANVSFAVPLDSIGKNVTLLFFITDNGGTLNGGKNASLLKKLVKLVLLAVNKPPRFTLARQSIVVSEGTSQVMQVFRNFATGISAGQPAEFSQPLQFYCDPSNSFLFDTQPRISFDGTLTFKTALNAFGQSNVSVRLSEFGEARLQAFSYFLIYVNRSYDAPAILSLAFAQLNLQEGSVNEFDKFVSFAVEANLPPSVVLVFNVSIALDRNSSSFLLYPDMPLINASVTSNGKLWVSCSPKSWGRVSVGITLMQTVVDNGVTLSISMSDLQVFTIVVSPVNDPPSFYFQSDSLVIPQQQAAFTSIGFIQNINVGPSDERSYQVISQMYCYSSQQSSL